MKQQLFIGASFAVAVIFAATSCTKNATSETEPQSSETSMHAEDQSRVSTGTDVVIDESVAMVEGTAAISGTIYSLHPTICDATILYDTLNAARTVAFTYLGTNCAGVYTRNGSVTLSIPNGVYWKNAGAVITIAYHDLKITRNSDHKSITINGSHLLTNVSGGLLVNLATKPNITHTVSSANMTVTFDDSKQRTWQLAQKRVFTYNNGVVITVTGNHTDGSNDGIMAWGTNRYGHSFTTAITQPIVIKQDCNFRITSGQMLHDGVGTATATYGLNKDGQAIGCPVTDSYYCKVDWTGPAGRNYSTTFPY